MSADRARNPLPPDGEAQLTELIDLARRISPQVATDLIVDAFHLAREAHEGQTRKSGEPYFNHVLEVGRTCAELNLGSNAIAAALLHCRRVRWESCRKNHRCRRWVVWWPRCHCSSVHRCRSLRMGRL